MMITMIMSTGIITITTIITIMITSISTAG